MSGAEESIVLSLFSRMDPAGIGISILLVLVSVYSWAMILERILFFRATERGFAEFERVFGGSRNLAEVAKGLKEVPKNSLSRLFERGYALLKEGFDLLKVGRSGQGGIEQPHPGTFEMQLDLLKQSLATLADEEATSFEKRLGVLGTIAAASPFIGLLGTVWGIMVAFYSMGSLGSADFKVVAAGISSALMTTVAGLVAAIPALISHNIFVHKGQLLSAKIDDFIDRFQRLAGRWFVQALSGTRDEGG
ncbi:MotA/TolQ/ExbB proton channel family protein [bacterium]|nr:MotA/TolQ/ExbB proton channel family protein [bacterium]